MTTYLETVLRLTETELQTLNAQFFTAHPKSILMWCLENISEGLIQSTAFGLSGMVIMDMLYRDLNPEPAIPVLFLDTLHHFSETLDLVQRADDLYRLDLQKYRPEQVQSREEFAQHYGQELWNHDVHRFHALTKVEPLNRALKDLNVQAWITGRRRDQSNSRQLLPIFEWDANQRLKVNPLANWTSKDVWKYIMENKVPYNVLHDRNYGSIGDEPLTTALQAGESERAGRWRGMNKTECGIHV